MNIIEIIECKQSNGVEKQKCVAVVSDARHVQLENLCNRSGCEK